jgi:hypothetical protein
MWQRNGNTEGLICKQHEKKNKKNRTAMNDGLSKRIPSEQSRER